LAVADGNSDRGTGGLSGKAATTGPETAVTPKP
jgi:hypothetical protein